jgi:hypothetical protein
VSPGSIVRFRNRDWVVLPSDDAQILLLRPLTGTSLDTFPFPAEECRRSANGGLEALQGPFAEAARAVAEYHEHRRQIIPRRRIGLPKTYLNPAISYE